MINLPPNTSLIAGATMPQLAISSDGTRIAVSLRSGSGGFQLYLRSLDQLEAEPIRGSEGGAAPFFSPDGQSVGFWSVDGKLKKVPIVGGAPFSITDSGQLRGATWLPDDTIVFKPAVGSGGLLRVPASGGKAVEFSKTDDKTELSHRWPEALPTRHLFSSKAVSPRRRRVMRGTTSPLTASAF